MGTSAGPRRVGRHVTARAAVALTVVAALVAAGCRSARIESRPMPSRVSFAFIGDAPYGAEAIARFPLLVEQVDADAEVVFVAHAGDVRGPGTDCSDVSLRVSFELFQTFDDAFWFTPGDNDWADCHRSGGYLPTERLSFLRSLFFPVPGTTTGGTPMQVETQNTSTSTAEQPFVENTLFARDCVVFGAVHVVGSGDDGEPWGSFPGDPAKGLAPGDQPERRLAERAARRAAALTWIDRVFDEAVSLDAEAVFVMMQAEPVEGEIYGDVRAKLLERAAAFARPVVLGHGDTHTYRFTPGYGGLANLTRLEVPGEATAIDRWVKVTATCGVRSAEVFTHEVLTFTVPPLPGG